MYACVGDDRMERKRVDRRRDKHVPKRGDGAAEVPP